MSVRLTELWRYPVKSCRGERLTQATVEPWGLAGDRRWMVVDDAGDPLTAREHPRMLLIEPRLTGAGSITFSAPDEADLTVEVPADAELVPVQVWKSGLLASPADGKAADWLSEVIGQSARLVYLDDPTRRPANPKYSRADDRVSFADGYPLLLTSEESLDGLNSWIAEGKQAAEGPVPMRRFRPNVVVAGTPAWAEDGWRRLRVGPVAFRNVKGCDRCVMTTVDPDTAAKGHEPLFALARHRRWDNKVWFGVNLIPDDPDPAAILRPGDPVEVIE
jgi:uncharacterized protein YcbX